MSYFYGGQAVVSIPAIVHNYRYFTALCGGKPPLAIVKANAYGHGLVPVSLGLAMAGCSWFGAAQVSEAVELAEQLADKGFKSPLMPDAPAEPGQPRILSWLWNPRVDLRPAVDAGIDFSIGSLRALEQVNEAAQLVGKVARVQIELDTDMARGGVAPTQAKELVKAVQASPNLRLTGVWTHFANADEDRIPGQAGSVARAWQPVADLVAQVDTLEVVHAAATAAVLKHWATLNASTMARVGIGLYGVAPSENFGKLTQQLRPAMQLEAKVTSVRYVPSGCGVSYGHTYVTDKPAYLATVGLGYADGLPRSASSKAKVWVNGQNCPVRGRICMDQFIVEVPSSVQPGDDVIIWTGENLNSQKVSADLNMSMDKPPTVADWAQWAQTIPYELLVAVGARVPRAYLDSSNLEALM